VEAEIAGGSKALLEAYVRGSSRGELRKSCRS